LLVLFLYLSSPSMRGLSSNDDVAESLAQSWSMLETKYPVGEPASLVLVLFAWIPLAAWRARSIRHLLLGVLFYSMVLSLLTVFEGPETNEMVCDRIASGEDDYAVDTAVRHFILLPIYVYSKVLPGFLSR